MFTLPPHCVRALHVHGAFRELWAMLRKLVAVSLKTVVDRVCLVSCDDADNRHLAVVTLAEEARSRSHGCSDVGQSQLSFFIGGSWV